MEEIKKTITVIEYKCSNCGKVHKKRDKIFKDPINDKEICEACSEQIELIDPDDMNMYLYEKTFAVGKNSVHSTILHDELERDVYRAIIAEIKKETRERFEQLNKYFLQNRLEEFMKVSNIDRDSVFKRIY